MLPVGEGRYVLLTQAMATVPLRELRRPVSSLADEHDAVGKALDILLLGF
ncbi:CcdB family protein [Rhizosaccharibacter radicis]|uniref:Toxin CcdB n=1 Tax=Rhizosaccharibacter radicis TaxID=2782605 RepID=A0ABT1VUW3_9PROT|nr:CcdB family protein [Acetobacteraceae bacterium KSS12]